MNTGRYYMREVAKLQSRLKNVAKNVTEYRMTVAEAKALLTEIEQILARPPVVVEVPVVKEKPLVEDTFSRIIDSGSFRNY